MYTESIQSLAHRLKEAQNSQPPRFIFFLGAGASDSSGIPIASWMKRDFERKLSVQWKAEGEPNGSFEAWLKQKPRWADNDSPYSKYFEAYEPTELGRVRYLNKWMQAASPGWGYFCLSQLLANSYLSTVVTTNFDDLIYESCTLHSVRRPRVYSASSQYTSVEHDHDRPTIIKLHGDYLYSNFKNTTREMQELDQRLMTEVSGLFQRHEVIVAGYSGADRRIMHELFKTVPSSNAVYWCTFRDSPMPELVTQLISGEPSEYDGQKEQVESPDNWFQVKTEGFDEFLDEIVNQLGFSLPGITQPMRALIDAIPRRVEGSNSRYTDKYFSEAIQQLRREEEELAEAYGVDSIQPTPYRLRLEAMSARRERRYDKAKRHYELLTKLPNQDTCEILIDYAVTLELMGEYEEALKLTLRIEPIISIPEDLGNFGWLLANLGKYEEGIKYFRRAVEKAPGLRQWHSALAMILSEDAQLEEARNYAQQLTEMYPEDSQMWATLSMINSLEGGYDPDALRNADKAVAINPTGLFEQLSRGFALSGAGRHADAISTLDDVVGEEDDIWYRALGHFHMLAGNTEAALCNLQKAVEFVRPAVRPKTLLLYGIAQSLKGHPELAKEAFKEACSEGDLGRRYKMDDELALALCNLGIGQRDAAISTVTKLSGEHNYMKGLLKEFADLLNIMNDQGIEGCDQCLQVVGSALAK